MIIIKFLRRWCYPYHLRSTTSEWELGQLPSFRSPAPCSPKVQELKSRILKPYTLRAQCQTRIPQQHSSHLTAILRCNFCCLMYGCAVRLFLLFRPYQDLRVSYSIVFNDIISSEATKTKMAVCLFFTIYSTARGGSGYPGLL